jgi:hypothetical protein
MNDFELALLYRLYPLHRVLSQVAQVLHVGRLTHPSDEGFTNRTPAHHINRALAHLEKLTAGDRSEPHLEHAATRLLLAIQTEMAR